MVKLLSIGVAIAAALALLFLLPGNAAPVSTSVEAVGTIVVIPSDKLSTGIEIPDARISLLDSSQAEVGLVKSDIDGRFRIKAPKPGTYSLCWNIQDRKGCKREIILKDPVNFIGIIKTNFKDLTLYGRVLTGDQRACWVRDPFFKLDVSTTVEVVDAANQQAAPKVRANVHGDYLFFVKSANTYSVTARCEKAKQGGSVAITSGAVALNLTLPNKAPRLDELATRSGGKGVTQVEPNTPIELKAEAKDPDGDTIEYLWRDDDGTVPVTTGGANQIVRNAPKADGLHSTYLMLRDDRGGYTFKRFDLSVGKPVIQIGGTVIDEVTRSPIAGARVELGNATATTNAAGWFYLSTPKNASDRYVLNIHHSNYAMWSQIFERANRSAVYELIRSQVTSQPNDVVMTVIDTRSGGWCESKTAKQPLRRATPIEYVDPDRKDGGQTLSADYIKKLTARVECKPRGAQIVLPAGSLVDAKGNKAKGNVRASVATLNPTRRAIPGDMRAIDGGGQDAELTSYGAVYAEFRDSSGNLLNLQPGTTADVTVPIPPSQLSTAKPTIDFWSYNEKSGKWDFEGKANLINTPEGPAYVGKTKHFSTLNMDIANDVVNATCLRFTLDSSLTTTWTNLSIRSTVSYNGNQVKTKETLWDGLNPNAVLRIPFGTAFPPNTVRLEVFGTFGGQTVALVDNVINTDAQPQMLPTAGLWPLSPYTECLANVNLAAPTGVVPVYATNDATNRPYFLTGPGGEFLPTNGDTTSFNYYTSIGAYANKPLLGDWWDANDFDPTNGYEGVDGYRASYTNHNDLGFGRDMHCRRNGANAACYVTNYGGPNQADSNADDAASQNALTRGATVAMEFTSGGGIEAVQFYVYGKGTGTGADAGLLQFADLDGFGPKPVPHLCLVCHGGGFNGTTNKAEYARFREFDLPTFRYPGGVLFEYGTPSPAQVNAPALGEINHIVRDIAPASSPIGNLITNWYPGGVYNIDPVLPAPPAGWAGSPDHITGYHEVYSTACRTCHLARDYGSASSSILFNTKANFDGTGGYVCGADYRVMPNAIITYKNFWLHPTRPDLFGLLMDPQVAAGTCKNDAPTILP